MQTENEIPLEQKIYTQTTPEPVASGDAKPEVAPAASVEAKPLATPEPFDVAKIKLPEGFERDDAALGKFAEIMNNDKLDATSRANSLVALQAEVMKGVSERASQAFVETQRQWQEEVRSDPSIGGEKLEPALGQIAQMIDTYPEAAKLREMMVLTGAGNHPQMIKFLHMLARERAEGKLTPAGQPTPSLQTIAERLYPSMKTG